MPQSPLAYSLLPHRASKGGKEAFSGYKSLKEASSWDTLKMMGILAENRKAKFNYEILKAFEAGLVLEGHEVKSIKQGRMQIAGSYIVPLGEELWLVGATVPPYQPKNAPADYNPQRPRKLLLKKDEIKYLLGKSQQRGLTLIPLTVYTKQGTIKLGFGIARGRKSTGKKEILKRRATEREMQRELRKRG